MQTIHEHHPYGMFVTKAATFKETVNAQEARPRNTRSDLADGPSLTIYLGSLVAAACIVALLQAFVL